MRGCASECANSFASALHLECEKEAATCAGLETEADGKDEREENFHSVVAVFLGSYKTVAWIHLKPEARARACTGAVSWILGRVWV